MRRLLYYAHQHGSGHLHHAAAAAATAQFDLTVVSAHPQAAEVVGHTADHAGVRQPRMLTLPPDLVDGHVQPAGSPLHHTPTGPEIRDRFVALFEAARTAGAEAAVVDVSVEAALFLRLAGYPVAHRRMHGDRTDPAHRIVYAEADHLIAHYRAELEDPDWLAAHGENTTYLGSPDTTGRLARTASTPPAGLDDAHIAVLTGTGGGGVALEALVRAAEAVPQATWHVHGPVRGAAQGEEPLPPNLVLHGWATDVAAVLADAGLVVVSAGHGGIVDAVASGRPLVLAPEPRPFDEQHRCAEAAHRCAGVPWAVWDDPAADWAGAVRTAAEDPASADRLATALLTPPEEYAELWEQAVERTIAGRAGASVSGPSA